MKKMLGLMIILIFALAACGGDNGKIVESAQNDAQDVVESVKDEIVVATEEEVVEQEVVEEAIKNTGDVVEEVSGEVDESMEAEVSDPSNVTFGTTAEEPVSSMLEGQVVDATTGTPLVEGLVCIQGTGLCASADGNGNYILADLPDGDWTLETTASGYFTAEQAVSIVAGETLTQNIVLSPEIVDGEIRIVLMWGGTSRDLDTWLKIPNGEDPTYLNYSNTGVEDSFPFAYLDLEDNG